MQWRRFLGLFDVVRVTLLQHHIDLGREDVLIEMEVAIVAAMEEKRRSAEVRLLGVQENTTCKGYSYKDGWKTTAIISKYSAVLRWSYWCIVGWFESRSRFRS